jgi:hypothetical protein
MVQRLTGIDNVMVVDLPVMRSALGGFLIFSEIICWSPIIVHLMCDFFHTMDSKSLGTFGITVLFVQEILLIGFCQYCLVKVWRCCVSILG